MREGTQPTILQITLESTKVTSNNDNQDYVMDIVSKSAFIFYTVQILCALKFVQPVKECLITQYSSDGFGHQVEGKLSCLLADYMHPTLRYVHVPFDQMQHTPELIDAAESFMNIGYGCQNEKDIQLHINKNITNSNYNHNYKSNSDIVKGKEYTRLAVNTSWIVYMAQQTVTCSPHILYAMDNCWELVYRRPYASDIDKYRTYLRERYFLGAKPDTGFDSNRKNVVVHIRRGDARARYMPLEYYKAGMAYYKSIFDAPVFWILSDDPKWPGHKKLKQSESKPKPSKPNLNSTVLSSSLNISGDRNIIKIEQRQHGLRTESLPVSLPVVEIHLPRIGDSLFTSFHRMVMADGLIMSRSSLSAAAALLSSAETLVTSSKHKKTPREDCIAPPLPIKCRCLPAYDDMYKSCDMTCYSMLLWTSATIIDT
eukprot:gene478-891_t